MYTVNDHHSKSSEHPKTCRVAKFSFLLMRTFSSTLLATFKYTIQYH